MDRVAIPAQKTSAVESAANSGSLRRDADGPATNPCRDRLRCPDCAEPRCTVPRNAACAELPPQLSERFFLEVRDPRTESTHPSGHTAPGSESSFFASCSKRTGVIDPGAVLPAALCLVAKLLASSTRFAYYVPAS